MKQGEVKPSRGNERWSEKREKVTKRKKREKKWNERREKPNMMEDKCEQ